MLRISSLIGNSQMLDGGAMFGNVPRALWQKWSPPDELGRIALECRCFLVEDGSRRILIESGVGAFFEPRLRDRYAVKESTHVLLRSLAARGLSVDDIDVVFLSHLHFDHAGGVLNEFREGSPLSLAFPRCDFVTSELAMKRARHPHRRDRASFIPELVTLLEASGRLHLVKDGQVHHSALGERVKLRQSQGHSPGMLIPTLVGSCTSATFCADLVPGVPWVHLPITMGYDRFPEALIDEKKFLYESLPADSWLLFCHDKGSAAGRLHQDDKGKYSAIELRSELSEWDLDD